MEGERAGAGAGAGAGASVGAVADPVVAVEADDTSAAVTENDEGVAEERSEGERKA